MKFKPIYAKPFNIKGLKTNLRKTLREEGKIDKRMLQKTTATWKGSKPRFRVVEKVTPNELSVEVIPSGAGAKKWNWIEEGTKAHIIRPKKRGGVLHFRTGFKPKTKVGKLKSGRGTRGKGWASAKMVRHPGTKPRLWRQVVWRKRNRPLLRKLRGDFNLLARSP